MGDIEWGNRKERLRENKIRKREEREEICYETAYSTVWCEQCYSYERQ